MSGWALYVDEKCGCLEIREVDLSRYVKYLGFVL